MKKLIQISLVLILICGLFQFVAAEPMDSASSIGTSAASSVDITADTPLEDTHMAACLVSIKGVICVMPNVGWNT
jgi:hypothetical protein